MPDPISSPDRRMRPDLETESPAVARPRRGGWFWALFPLIGFALFGTVVWLAYRDVTRGPPVGEAPLVKAAADPIKLPPEQAADALGEEGGTVGRLWSDAERAEQPERLLPLPEEPLSPLTVTSPDADRAPLAEATAPSLPSPPETPAGESETGALTTPADAPAATEGARGGVTEAEAALDRLLAEVTALSDEPASAADETPAPTAAEAAGSPPEDARAVLEASPSSATLGRSPPGEPVSADAESEASVGGTPDAAVTADVRPDRAPETPTAPSERAAPSAEAAALSTAPTPATRVAAIEDRFRVQVAAVRAEADAQRAWRRFEQDLGPLLSDVQPFFERAETANGVFYRVQIGPFGTQQAAESLCAELKQHNASCFVIRR